MVVCSAREALKSRFVIARAFLGAALLSSTAQAGHAPLVPEPRTILLREDAPEHIVIGTRRGGYFVTRDAGATWSWMCEAGIGYDDEEVYPGALLPGGTLVVSTGFGGIAASADGCGFTPWLPSAQPFVADVRAQTSTGGVLALEARSDGEAFVNQLWQSANGLAWQALGPPFAPDTLATSFAISDQGELYVGSSGTAGADLLHSADSAQSWERVSITSEPGVTPRVVGAQGAAEHARVFVVADYVQADGLTTAGDSALLSADGGRTFSPLLQAKGDLSSWSLSPDGARLAVGGHTDGIHVLANASQASAPAVMTQVSTRSVHALAWGAGKRLYAAGHEAIDGFSVGVSEDDGRSFRPAFALCQVQGPLACPEGTSVGASCQSAGETGWDVRKEVSDSRACEPPVPDSGSPAAGETDPESVNDVRQADAGRSEEEAGCAFSPRPPASHGRLVQLLTVLLLAFVSQRRGSRTRSQRARRLRPPPAAGPRALL